MYKWGLEFSFTSITGNDFWQWLPIFNTKQVCEDFWISVIFPALQAADVSHIEHICKIVN